MEPQHSLAVRSLSALFAIPIVLALLWLGGWPFACGAIVLLAFALYETVSMLRRKNVHPLWPISFLLGLLCYAYVLPSLRMTAVFTGLCCLVVAAVWLHATRRRRRIADLCATYAFPLYVGGAFACLLRLRGPQAPVVQLHPLTVPVPEGIWWVLVVLVGTWAFDTGAYLVGRKLGRHKMAPLLSPKKSWEGIGGGLLFVVPAVLAISRPVHLGGISALVLALGIAIAATLGDLAESWIKRWTGVKDSGHFLPGHGGLLDRIDSILLVTFVVSLVRFLHK